MKIPVLLVLLSGLAACASHPPGAYTHKEPEVLRVHNDGTMFLNERAVNKKDVVIYPDGYGGERAAIKVHMPLKPDFYRDTIRVQREDMATDVKQN
jgi:hypothetical protein